VVVQGLGNVGYYSARFLADMGAIVVAVSTTAVALAIVILIKQAYGTVEEDQILEMTEEG